MNKIPAFFLLFCIILSSACGGHDKKHYLSEIAVIDNLADLKDLQESIAVDNFQEDGDISKAIRAKIEKLKVNRPIQFNINILLDLSNRISPELHSEQAERDMKVINLLLDYFEQEVKRKLYIMSKDRISVHVAYQQQNKQSFSQYADKLHLNIEKIGIKDRRQNLPTLKSDFSKSVTDLYNSATQNNDFQGADIWSFFNQDLNNHILNSTDADSVRNVLVVLTDGYIVVNGSNPQNCVENLCPYMTGMENIRKAKANWQNLFGNNKYGVLPIKKEEFRNLELLVLEINPIKNDFVYEYDMVKQYWENWLEAMNIKKYKIAKTEDASENTKNIIGSFFGQTIKTINLPPTAPNPNSTENPIEVESNPKITDIKGTFIGNLNGFARQLNISEISPSSEFTYTINGLGDKEKNKKGTIDLEKQTIFLETLGNGTFSQKDGKFIITSTENKWTFTKQNN